VRVLVVGGAGYIGSHAARTLRRRAHEVVIYDNLSTGHASFTRGFEFVKGDIHDSMMLTRVLPAMDAVMHFAAFAYVGESVENPRKYFANNVEGGLALLNACVDSGIRKVIFSSTCAVYGVPEKIPISEENPRQPVNPYGISKMFFERALESYDRAYSMRYASLRYFNAAGADEDGEVGEWHDPETHLIPRAMQAVMGTAPPMDLYGTDYPTPDGTCVRDYVHVNDLADAHVLALEHLDRGGSFAVNLGTGRGYSVREVLDSVKRVSGREVPVRIVGRRPGDPPSLVADPSRAEKLLHWKASRSIDHVVETAWKWMQKSQEAAHAGG